MFVSNCVGLIYVAIQLPSITTSLISLPPRQSLSDFTGTLGLAHTAQYKEHHPPPVFYCPCSLGLRLLELAVPSTTQQTTRRISSSISVYQLLLGLYTLLLLPILYSVLHTTGGLEGGSYIAQQPCNSIATVWAMQSGRKNEMTIDSCTNDEK